MLSQPLERPRCGATPVSRAFARVLRHIHAIADLRRRVEMALVERLDPGVSVDILPVMVVVAVFASLLPSRRT